MRDDHKLALKKVKQQLNAFCLRHGYRYEKTKWTIAHLKWLKQLELSTLYRETLDEYMASYDETACYSSVRWECDDFKIVCQSQQFRILRKEK